MPTPTTRTSPGSWNWDAYPGQERAIRLTGFDDGYLDGRAYEFRIRGQEDVEGTVGDTDVLFDTIVIPTGTGAYRLQVVDVTDPDHPDVIIKGRLQVSDTGSDDVTTTEVDVITTDEVTLALDVTVLSPASAGGGATTLDELTDVDTSGATPGQVLGLVGATWEPVDQTGGVTQGELDAAVEALEDADEAEATSRLAGDTALDTRLDAIEALGPLATAASVTAEATARGNADTALDGRVDALEAAPPAHAVSHGDGGGDELALAGEQITSGTVAADRLPSTITTKVGHLTVTQAVDLDAIEARVNSLDAAVVLRGNWDASAGTFPGGGTAQAGDSYIVTVAGTVNAIAFSVGDRIVAITDNASTSTYAANWLKLDYTDAVLSVTGAAGGGAQTGAVSLGTAQVVAADDITNTLLANMGQATVKGRASGAGTGDPVDLTAAQLRAIANVEDGADVTDAANVDAAGAVMNTDYDAQTILAATADNTPTARTIDEARLVGRLTGGNIAGLTPAQVRGATMLDLYTTGEVDGEIADAIGALPATRGGLVVSGSNVDVAAIDVQEFTTAGTFSGGSGWQKPANLVATSLVHVFMRQGGGGGGGGRKGAEGGDRAGGNGGNSGAVVEFWVLASALASQETVVVAAGGTAGTGPSANSTNGGNGGDGPASTFAGRSTPSTGNGGGGGASAITLPTMSAATEAAARQTASARPVGIGGLGFSNAGLAPVGGQAGDSGAGGGGTWRSAANADPIVGATGGNGVGAAGGAGSVSTTGTAGSSSSDGLRGGGGGGGGGAASAGGAGGWPSGGGGGGGRGVNSSTNGGPGGVGGHGYVRITTYR